MKKTIPKNKEAFADMLMREYGYDEKISKEVSVIVAGHGAFNPILHDPDALQAVELLREHGYSAEDICVALRAIS